MGIEDDPTNPKDFPFTPPGRDRPRSQSIRIGPTRPNQPDIIDGKYVLARELGAGGMGVVCLAAEKGFGDTPSMHDGTRNTPLGQVAIKLIKYENAPPNLVQRFLDEIKMCTRVRHANVVGIKDSGVYVVEGVPRPYYVMEHVEGGARLTDPDVTSRHGLRARVRLFAKAVAAAQAIHEAGVIHADLKPSNILVKPDLHTPMVTDFGLARTARELGLGTPAPGGGTAAYLAPELVNDPDFPHDRKTDLYALGVTLHQFLTGLVPRPGAPLPDPTQANPDIDPRLASIIARATDADRARRYDTARQMHEDLESWLASPRHRARLALREQCRTRRWAVLLAAAVIATVLAGELGGRVLFKWTNWAGSLDPRIKSATTAEPDRNVAIVAVTDKNKLSDACAEHGETIEPEADGGLRPAYALVAEKLAEASPRVVLWRIYFKDLPHATRFNDRLLTGLKSLAGVRPAIPSIVYLPAWDPDHQSPTGLVPGIERVGSSASPGTLQEITAAERSVVGVHLAVRRANPTFQPAGELCAQAEWMFRGSTPLVTTDDHGEGIRVQYVIRDPGPESHMRIVGTHVINASVVPISPANAWEVVGAGIQAGDTTAYVTVTSPTEEQWRAVIHDAADVVRAPPDRLRQWFAGKAVYVTYPRQDPTVLSHAAALEQLLSDRVLRMIGGTERYAATAAGCALGLLAVESARPRPKRPGEPTKRAGSLRRYARSALQVVAIATALAGAWLLCNSVTHWLNALYHPVLPMLAVLCGAAATALVPTALSGAPIILNNGDTR